MKKLDAYKIALEEKRSLFICNSEEFDGYEHPFKLIYDIKNGEIFVKRFNSNGILADCSFDEIPCLEYKELFHDQLKALLLMGDIY